MSGKKVTIALGIVTVLVALGMIIWDHQEYKPSTNELDTRPVKVGVVLPLTGILSEMGQTERRAMELAVEHLNDAGETQVKLLIEDGKGDAKTVVSAVNKLINIDKVDILVTSTTGASLAAQPIADSYKIPLMAFCMDSEVAENSPMTVRYYIGIEEESEAIVNAISHYPPDTRVAILHGSVAAWITAINDIYKPRLSSTLDAPILIQEYRINDNDFRSQLSAIRSNNTDLLVILGYGFEYQPMFRQIDEVRLRAKTDIIGGWGFLYTPLSTETLEGIRVAGPVYVFDKGEKGSAFHTAFLNRYGSPPNFDAAFAYELASQIPAISKVLHESGPKAIKPFLISRGTVQGTFGPYHFDEQGNLKAETAIGVYHNGEIISLDLYESK